MGQYELGNTVESQEQTKTGRNDDQGPVSPTPAVRRLDFDSEHLGGPVLALEMTRVGPDVSALDAIVNRATATGAHLISCRIARDQREMARALETVGFREIERFITLRRPIPTAAGDRPGGTAMPPTPAGIVIEHAQARDHAASVALGRTAFAADRFHADPLIEDTRANRLKAAWVANALAGRADLCLVARCREGLCGFNLCMLRDDEAIIDLIAVDPRARRRGLGGALVARAIESYVGRAVAMRLGTQQHNHASLAMYRRLGFEPIAESVTYHYTRPLTPSCN